MRAPRLEARGASAARVASPRRARLEARRAPAVVLTVGGLDPSGGAGVVADVRAIALAGSWPCVVCASLTVQSTRGLRAVRSVSAELVRAQIEELLADVRCDVVKTGALGSAANAGLLVRLAHRRPELRLVVDPVMTPTRGSRGSDLNAGRAALGRLLGAAALATPNAPEAEALLGARICTAADARQAALELERRHGCAVLLKGGHLAPRARAVCDFLASEGTVSEFVRRRLHLPATHGTGCTLASLVAGRLAAAGPAGRPSHAAWRALIAAALELMEPLLHGATALGRGLAVLGAAAPPHDGRPHRA